MKILVCGAAAMHQAWLAMAYVSLGHEVIVIDSKPWEEWAMLIPGSIGVDCADASSVAEMGPFDRVVPAY